MAESGKISEKAARQGQFITHVLSQEDYCAGHKSLLLEVVGAGSRSFQPAKAGQFIQIACRDLQDSHDISPFLRRPFSLAGIRESRVMPKPGTGENAAEEDRLCVEILYRIIGPGTQWLARREKGDTVDILGPLGNGFTLPEKAETKTILIGGGIGLPPLYFLAEQLRAAGIRERIGFAGGRDATYFESRNGSGPHPPASTLQPEFLIRHFTLSQTPCVIATDDGSMGFPGSNVQALLGFLDQNSSWKEAEIFACGPAGMLRAAVQLAEQFNMRCQVCLEAYMSCGMGICQSCAVPVRLAPGVPANPHHVYKLVCTNGPVFDAKTIDWEANH